jgi:hypothetical protein
MSFLLNLLFSLGFAAAVAGAVHVWRSQLDAARREGMRALAARRGWALTLTGERLGRAGTLRLAPRGGLPWTAEVRPKSGRARGFLTEYEAPEPRWESGTLILIAAEPKITTHDGAEADDASLQRGPALKDLLGAELSRMSGTLEPIEAPDGLTAFAVGEVHRRVDLQDLGRALQSWVPVTQGPRGVPVLILSPEGMRLRLRRGLRRPDQMERFLDLALDLARLIGP